MTLGVAARPNGVDVFDSKFLVATNERAVVVSNESTSQEMGLDEGLETVADTEDGHPLVRRIDDLAHDGRVSGNRAAPQIVTVRETPGENDGVDTVQVRVAVPEGDGVTAGEFDGTKSVAVVERPGECDDADAHVSPPRESKSRLR